MASSSHVRFHAIRLEPGDELKSSLLSYIQKNNLRAGLKVFIISDNLHSYNSTGIPLKHFTFPLFLKLHNKNNSNIMEGNSFPASTLFHAHLVAFVVTCVGSLTKAKIRLANSSSVKDLSGYFEIVSLGFSHSQIFFTVRDLSKCTMIAHSRNSVPGRIPSPHLRK
jgi:hypothetical protein